MTLTSYSDYNKYESTLLKTWFDNPEKVIVGGSQSGEPNIWWKYTRHRTKNYQYVGMDKETAKACMDAKIEQYNRTMYNWIQTGSNRDFEMPITDDNSYRQQVAQVQASKQNGCLWNVDIQVDETVVAYFHLNKPQDPYAAFNQFYWANWSYDE